MNEAPIYRITVEAIGQEKEGHEILAELKAESGGLACDGFVIIGICKGETETAVVSVNDVTPIELASTFAKEGRLLAAAHIGEAIKNAAKVWREAELHDELTKCLGGVFGDHFGRDANHG